MEKIKSSLDVRLRLLSTIYKILGSFSCEALEIGGVRSHNEMSQQAIPSRKATDKFYGLGSRNKHHLVPVCLVRLLSAMICISPRDSLSYSALCLQQLGRSCVCVYTYIYAAAAAKQLQLCLTLCDPRDGSPPGSPVPGILQARTLEWIAISFSNA